MDRTRDPSKKKENLHHAKTMDRKTQQRQQQQRPVLSTISDNGSKSSVEYWRKEAEHATLYLRVVQQLTKEVLVSQQNDVDVDRVAKNIVQCMEREWEDRERVLREEFKVTLGQVEERYKRELAQVVEESKRLDSALLYIKGLCDGHEDGFEGVLERAEEDLVHVVARAHENDDVLRQDGAEMKRAVMWDDEDGKIESYDGTSSSVEDGEIEYDVAEDLSVMYARDEGLRVSHDSFCPVVAFRGEDPEVLTENAMDRILDHPGRMYRGSAYKSKYVGGKHVSTPSWRIPSLHTRTMLVKEIQELETKLKKKTVSDSVESKDEPKFDVVEEDEFVRTIQALGETSPTTAGLMIQHVSDSWAVQRHTGKDADVNRVKKSAPSTKGSKKSSFLGRQPISLNEVFSSSTPMWTH